MLQCGLCAADLTNCMPSWAVHTECCAVLCCAVLCYVALSCAALSSDGTRYLWVLETLMLSLSSYQICIEANSRGDIWQHVVEAMFA